MPDGEDLPTPRVRVVRSQHAPLSRRTALTDELTEQSGLGQVYVDGLMRAQRRLSVTILLIGLVAMAVLPGLFTVRPELQHHSIGGIPVVWAAVTAVIFPTAVIAAAYYVRRSERIERQFTELVLGETSTP